MILILCMSILVLIIAILMLNNDVYNSKIRLEKIEKELERPSTIWNYYNIPDKPERPELQRKKV